MARVPDPERQWLFVQTFGGKRLQDLRPEVRERAQAVAIQALLASDATAYWLSVIDLDGLQLKERRELLARAEKLGRYPGRSWVLYELALANYELGEASEALTILRRLLVEREEVLDNSPLEEACVALAARLFLNFGSTRVWKEPCKRPYRRECGKPFCDRH